VEQTQVPISVIQGFVHVYVNPAYCRLLGYEEREELLGKPLEATIAQPDRDMVRERYRRRLAGIDVPSVYELRHLRKDGSIVWVEASVQLREFEGRPAVQAASRKISKREPRGGKR
jgi:PAS domain S-box-containing protein